MTLRTDEFLQALPKGLRDGEGAEEFLRGILGPVARIDEFLEVKRGKLPQLYDPSEAPDAVLRFLAAMVGFGADLPAAYALSKDDLRRLVPVAVGLWKKKGTTDSWREILTFIAAARLLLLDWFYYRIVDGSSLELHMMPCPGTSLPGSYAYPEAVADLWVMDPGNDINLGTNGKIAGLLRTFRPIGARINLIRAFFVEDLLVGVNLWTMADPGKAGDGYRDASGRPRLVSTDGNSFVSAAQFAVPAGAQHLFFCVEITGTGRLYAHQASDTDTDTGYEVSITPATGVVSLGRRSAGTLSTLLSVSIAPMTEGYPYRWTIDLLPHASTTEITVRWEGNVVITVLDGSGARRTTGRPGWGAAPGPDNRAVLTALLAYLHGTTPTRIGPT